MKYFEQMREELMGRLEAEGELEDAQILELIDEMVLRQGRIHGITLPQKDALRRGLFYSVRKLDAIQELVEDESVTEIMVNDHEHIFIERDGRLLRWEKSFSTRERLEDVIQQIAGSCNRVVNEQSPIVDARLENGARVNVVLPPVSLSGPVLTIRRFPKDPVTMEKLIHWDAITPEAAAFLENLVQAGYTIMVGGGTSTGKTTFLNALSAYIPADERVITIEDTAELQIRGLENLVRLETRNANIEGSREITIRDLIRTALRMRPSRIIVGEVRSAEAEDFLACLNTGHSGSLGTAHANSTRDMIGRLEMMVLMGAELPIPVIRRQIASGIEILVHLSRTALGKREVEEISELTGMQGDEVEVRTLFRRGEDGVLRQVQDLLHQEKRRKLQQRQQVEEEVGAAVSGGGGRG